MMNVVIHFYVVLVFVCGSHALPKKEKLNDSNLNTCLFDCGRCVGILGEDKYKRDACMEKCEETNGASRDPDCKNSDFVKVDKLDACLNACAHCTFIHGKSVYIGGACLKECRKTKGESIDPECKNPEFLMTEKERECLASCKECCLEDYENYNHVICRSKCRYTKGASNDPDCTKFQRKSGKKHGINRKNSFLHRNKNLFKNLDYLSRCG
ncbi:uncharacterized protein LOC116303290 [Actinia tenebrosa]|uniref:Uncharacterized protein LOC116303290 n=1 Tax=Actinia tenebrosa TaxID=6105 RepID=A0A6P8IQW9_ACTTE|nr:uncharacterized protein LOC116303290 [Actinia tenebrosa]XP_031568668.1 uncharacterized protein LOC116303290 [Actinia tenebrosa]